MLDYMPPIFSVMGLMAGFNFNTGAQAASDVRNLMYIRTRRTFLQCEIGSVQ